MGARYRKSGRRPSSRASQLRLDPFTVFLDENHSRNKHILKVLGDELQPKEQVIGIGTSHDFPSGMLDEQWLPIVGQNGWIVVSADARIWRRTVLRELLFQYGVRAFFFTENNSRGETKAQILKGALPEMRKLVAENDPPFVGSITTEGHAHIIFDRQRHRRVTRNQKAAAIRRTKPRRRKVRARSARAGR